MWLLDFLINYTFIWELKAIIYYCTLYYTLRYNVIVFIMKDNEEAVKDASTKSTLVFSWEEQH